MSNHLTSFASSFYVPVNTIDFAYVFANANLAENHTVFTVVISLLGGYILMLIWLRKKDKQDLLKVTFLDMSLVSLPSYGINAYLCIL